MAFFESHPRPRSSVTIFTIGHSTRSIADFVSLLREHAIQLLVDVRTLPRSRANPQFNGDVLPDCLAANEIDYAHMPDLGGLRRPSSDSPNSGWRNASFRGYADYMATPQFREALERLIGLAGDHTLAVMCAEAVPWRCHRSLIGDALVVRGIEVIDIIGPGSSRTHQLTPFAKVDGTSILYPPEAVS